MVAFDVCSLQEKYVSINTGNVFRVCRIKDNSRELMLLMMITY